MQIQEPAPGDVLEEAEFAIDTDSCGCIGDVRVYLNREDRADLIRFLIKFTPGWDRQ